MFFARWHEGSWLAADFEGRPDLIDPRGRGVFGPPGHGPLVLVGEIAAVDGEADPGDAGCGGREKEGGGGGDIFGGGRAERVPGRLGIA